MFRLGNQIHISSLDTRFRGHTGEQHGHGTTHLDIENSRLWIKTSSDPLNGSLLQRHHRRKQVGFQYPGLCPCKRTSLVQEARQAVLDPDHWLSIRSHTEFGQLENTTVNLSPLN
ncbi:hypothetical protein PsorP6_002143 [Peronosclerospora sorghi]|uniref:Uncharacterized protein n=1 Tax=Peronosclerospora sorghi TaxID=230839 RepID=A0ACC0WRM0_9STRA|nr:hypothetical protein PsorP6_002143 [Peronosclerospora sorghi]